MTSVRAQDARSSFGMVSTVAAALSQLLPGRGREEKQWQIRLQPMP